jgi:hypothetical protein
VGKSRQRGSAWITTPLRSHSGTLAQPSGWCAWRRNHGPRGTRHSARRVFPGLLDGSPTYFLHWRRAPFSPCPVSLADAAPEAGRPFTVWRFESSVRDSPPIAKDRGSGSAACPGTKGR